MLPDTLAENLKLVFCGTAAGAKSAAVGAYYAGPGNKFWPMLYETGLTKRLFRPEEFKLLPTLGIGLTDLVKHKSGSDSHLSQSDFNDISLFREKIERYRPGILCFNGKKAAQQFFQTTAVDYGLTASTIGKTRIFIAPSTSGAANGFWDPSHWHTLSQLVSHSGDCP